MTPPTSLPPHRVYRFRDEATMRSEWRRLSAQLARDKKLNVSITANLYRRAPLRIEIPVLVAYGPDAAAVIVRGGALPYDGILEPSLIAQLCARRREAEKQRPTSGAWYRARQHAYGAVELVAEEPPA